MRRHPLTELAASLRSGSVKPERPARPKRPARQVALVEIRVWLPDHSTLRLRGELDNLELDNDFIDVTSRRDTMKTFVVGERKFTVSGRFRPWKKRDLL